MALIEKEFYVKGMVCSGCEKIIKDQVLLIPGVKKINIDYTTGKAKVHYDDSKVHLDVIFSKIEAKGYSCFKNPQNSTNNRFIYFVLIMFLALGIKFYFEFFQDFQMPSINSGIGYGLLFVIGLFTGFHCIGMCGGFVLSYTTKYHKSNGKSFKIHLYYAFGKLISYTFFGAMFGLLGQFISFTPIIRGMISVFAGILLILYGFNMLNIFSFLKKIRFSIFPKKLLFKIMNNKITNKLKISSPLMFGLLNGLMIACGPLQAIYILAAGSASMIVGAKLLFVFALGTLPVMIGFGYFASLLSKKINLILKLSGYFILILGLIMLNRGLILTGSGNDFDSIIDKSFLFFKSSDDIRDNETITEDDDENYQEIFMNVTRYGFEPNEFILTSGIPVKWHINGMEINGCNNAIQVPSYNLYFDVSKGEQIIEFTPTQKGVIRWSCWMGMIPGKFIVE